MALLLTGTCLGVEARSFTGADGGPVNYTVVHMLDGFQKTEVTLGRTFAGPVPGEGEDVVLEVEALGKGNGRVALRAHAVQPPLPLRAES